MSDSEDDSSNSEKNWPMNEDWMMDILKDDDKSEAKVKINVTIQQFTASNGYLIKRSVCSSISVPNQYVNRE